MPVCVRCGSSVTVTRKDGWIAWYKNPNGEGVICSNCHSAIGGRNSRGIAKGPFSTKHREKISKAKLGIKRSAVSRAKQSASTKGEKNWNYGKKATPETRVRLRQSHLGQVPWNKGKFGYKTNRIFTPEELKAISERSKGRKPSDEVKAKISIANKGQIAWNKGKTGIFSKEILERISRANKGKIPWNKGKKSPYTPEQLQKYSQAQIGKKQSAETIKKRSEAMKISAPWKGKHLPDELKATLSIRKLGMSSPMQGKKMSAETSALLSRQRRGRPNPKNKIHRLFRIFPKVDTKPEKALQAALTIAGIVFEKHKPIVGQPDIFIPDKLVIMCDGDYWHANPAKYKAEVVIKGKVTASQIWEYDGKVTENLQSQGYTVLRFWESEIKADLLGCIKKVQEALK